MKKNNDTKDRVFIPKTIGESLKKVNKKFSNQFGKIEYLIHSKWLQIVGSFFAKHSEPIKISSSKDNLEDGDTLEDNAFIKAFLTPKCPHPAHQIGSIG